MVRRVLYLSYTMKKLRDRFMKSDNVSAVRRMIIDLIPEGAKVLELGCSGGELLSLLREEKNVNGHGLEIDDQAIYQCVAKGLSVLRGDIEQGLSEYRDKSFDFVIMDRTFQELKNPDKAVSESIRVGREAIITFPNFVYLGSRLQILLKGRVPVTSSLPYQWYDTPNLHFLGVSDFIDYCRTRKITIVHKAFISKGKNINILPNLFAEIALFAITMK